MLQAVTGFSLRPSLLEAVLCQQQRERLREDYGLQLLWLMGLQLFTLAGGQDYPVPDPAEALAPVPATHVTGQSIRQDLLRRLQAERSNPWRNSSNSPQP